MVLFENKGFSSLMDLLFSYKDNLIFVFQTGFYDLLMIYASFIGDLPLDYNYFKKKINEKMPK